MFALLLLAGRPIVGLGDKAVSLAYALGVYTPVIALCLLAYKRLR